MNYEQLLKELVEKDDRYVVMTAENRAAIRGLPNVINEKFIDTGITEQTMVGAAAGLALRGRIPIIHALATFLTLRAFEFVRTDVGIGALPVKLVGGVAGFLSEANGPTHQAIEDVALMRGIPGMSVFCPADEEDMLLGLPKIFESANPFYIRYNNLKPSVSHTKNFEIGKGEIIEEGNEVSILTYGMMLGQAVVATEELKKKGISVRLINLRTLKPVDEELILKTVQTSALTVTLEDHFLTGGLFSIVAEILLKRNVTGKVLPIALDEKWFKPALLKDVLEYEGFTGEKIAKKIILELEKKSAEIDN